MTDGRWLIVIVRKPWFNMRGGPWDAYHKAFCDPDSHGKSAIDQYLEWWHGLKDDSFTKTKAEVTMWWATPETSLLVPWAPPDQEPGKKST